MSPTRPDELVRRARGDTERADQALALQMRQVEAAEHANALREREIAAVEAHESRLSASEAEDGPAPVATRRPRTRTAS